MNGAPINVKQGAPTVPPDDWEDQVTEWRALNDTRIHGRIGNRGFTPLTIKFGYVFGVMYIIWESVACLLQDKEFAKESSYIPACGLFLSGAELLGRCVIGKTKIGPSTLNPGLQWLKEKGISEHTARDITDIDISQVNIDEKWIRTSTQDYSILQLNHLRNFAAHGQATSDHRTIDYELIYTLGKPFINGLETYWWYLQRNDDMCNNLAKANIVPFHKSAVMKIWFLLDDGQTGEPQTITHLFDKLLKRFRL